MFSSLPLLYFLILVCVCHTTNTALTEEGWPCLLVPCHIPGCSNIPFITRFEDYSQEISAEESVILSPDELSTEVYVIPIQESNV